MDRETKTIITPLSAQKVEVKTYLIGREKRSLQNILIGKNISISADGENVSGFDASTLEQRENLAWKLIVVSIDGHKDGDTIEGKDTPFSVVDTILDMRADDYSFIVSEINILMGEKKS